MCYYRDRHRGGVTKEGGIPAQVSRLANAVLAYAKNIEKVEALLPVVERIGYRHICRDVKPVQYGAVAECLLAALKIQLKDAATEDFIAAWKEAIEHLAAVFIDVEAKLRAELEEKAGYSGFVAVVVDQVEELDSKTVLSLVPKDHGVPAHEEGQFVGVRIETEGNDPLMCTMDVYGSHTDSLKIVIADNEEKATKALKACTKGSVLYVSVPCGKGKSN